eukprot:SM000114S24147  [mRNA]  locus=s114:245615:250091:- [translate_table: standard]
MAHPDCVEKRIVGVNGKFPAPTIDIYSNDTVEINVHNQLPVPTSIHWHGMHQVNSQWQDGPFFGTQCPIQPGMNYTYRFSPNGQRGTFWWHAHIGMQRSSLFGGFHVRSVKPLPFKKPYGEPFIVLMDWWHKNDTLLEADLQKPIPSIWQGLWGPADSLLINGRGAYDCSFVDPTDGYTGACKQSYCPGPTKVVVQPNQTYRFHFVNAGLLTPMQVKMEGHTMWMVEVDSVFTKPIALHDGLEILPGQGYSVLVKMNQKPKSYWITVDPVLDQALGAPQATAVFHYEGSDWGWGTPKTAPPVLPDDLASGDYTKGWHFNNRTRSLFNNDAGLKANKVDQLVVVQFAQRSFDKVTRYALNNYTFKFGDTPMLLADYLQLPGAFVELPVLPTLAQEAAIQVDPNAPAKEATTIIDVKYGNWVQIVIQNSNFPGLAHPFHLHGMVFYVVGRGNGTFDATKAFDGSYYYNTVDPIARNVVTIYDKQWVAIRFHAINPGMWNFHCHLEPHIELGMQTYVRISSGGNKTLPKPPADFPTCGKFTPAIRAQIQTRS